jgi:hypothetical protein
MANRTISAFMESQQTSTNGALIGTRVISTQLLQHLIPSVRQPVLDVPQEAVRGDMLKPSAERPHAVDSIPHFGTRTTGFVW